MLHMQSLCTPKKDKENEDLEQEGGGEPRHHNKWPTKELRKPEYYKEKVKKKYYGLRLRPLQTIFSKVWWRIGKWDSLLKT